MCGFIFPLTGTQQNYVTKSLNPLSIGHPSIAVYVCGCYMEVLLYYQLTNNFLIYYLPNKGDYGFKSSK